MELFRLNNRGVIITGAEIACFIVINILMLLSFSFGSSIRKAQDISYLAKIEDEKRREQEAESARKIKAGQQKNAHAEAQKKSQQKLGIIETDINKPRQRNVSVNIKAAAPAQFKKLAQFSASENKTAQQQNTPVKQPDKPENKTETAQNDATAEINAGDNFSDRFSSLFFTDIDSIGVELYDYDTLRSAAKHEIALLRLLNALSLNETEEIQNNELYMSIQTEEASIALNASKRKPAFDSYGVELAVARGKTSEIAINSGELAAKFLHCNSAKVYIGTNHGLYQAAIENIPDFFDEKKTSKYNLNFYLPGQLPEADIIAMCSNGANILFAGTASSIYMIDLSKNSAVDIGIDNLFENSDWYSICYYNQKLYLANYEALFYYDMQSSKWSTVAYEKFIGIKKCQIQYLIVYEEPAKLTPNYMLLTSDYGLITDKMPPFDPAAFKYERADIKAKIYKKLFNRMINVSKPSFAFNDPNGIWLSFEEYEKNPYEMIRFDKKSEKYERYSKSEKVKCIYAIDMAMYNESLMFATNGEELFSIIRMWGDANTRIYGFYPLASITKCFSVAISGKTVICATVDGKIYKIDISELIKSIEKL